jgi:adenine-specific DNA-methyltransferase
VVYTKPWVVELILDMVGYTVDQPLHERVLIEPAAGDGSFLVQAAARLVKSCRQRRAPVVGCVSSIVAYELNAMRAAKARAAVLMVLKNCGVSPVDAQLLADSWVRSGDYLMESAHMAGIADYVVGNPPYIRLEDLGESATVYRSAYPTMIGRADIYVAFFEAALRHLKSGGVCGFICADRWMFNQYGGELRRFITGNFNVCAVVQMHHADAFETEVNAYPAVTLIRKEAQGPVMVATLKPDAEGIGSAALSREFTAGRGERKTNAAQIDDWFRGSDPWPLMHPMRLALLRRLEAEFPALESTGAKVGIGVATGADKVFVTKDPELVEPERLLPLAMAKDAKNTPVNWSGHYLVNPWNGKGLVNLNEYPRLAAYLGKHRDQLLGRHVGKKVPANWFRTIDPINAQLTTEAKLYLPDFKGRISPALDLGETYPHHNLYFIIPDPWDPEVLGGLLLSDVAQFFIEAYGVRMRGGFLRFQAQYLRRIRVPPSDHISREQSYALQTAFKTHDVALANRIATELYNLSTTERESIGHSETIS